jgi:protein TonB
MIFFAVPAAVVTAAPVSSDLGTSSAPAGAIGADSIVDVPVTHPDWTRRPSRDDLMRLYPRGVTGVRGQVRARCLIDANGKFMSCDIISEEPAGKGFGEATIRLSKLFQMKLLDADGLPVAGRKLTLPVLWRDE